ncbi:MAG: SDR family NAD(P)-dependent oxidoreductase, partial [Pseudomonadota bacterium]
PHRVSLPTYPFAKERYWLAAAPHTGTSAGGTVGGTERLHPLLHRNSSDLDQQRYSSTFDGGEYFLADHVMQGRRLLPGVAQVEMAHEAVLRALGDHAGAQVELRDIVFARPVAVAGPLELHIGLQREADASVTYEIYSRQGDTILLHGQGRARPVQAAAARIDLHALQAGCTQVRSGPAIYERLDRVGMHYGPAMRALQEIRSGADVAVGRLVLPREAALDADRYRLNPSLVDGSLLASIGLLDDAVDGERAALPFAIERVLVRRALPREVYAVVRANAGGTAQVRKLDIVICDEQGEVCAELTGFSSRVPETAPHEVGTVLMQASWTPREAAPLAGGRPQKHVVLLCAMEGVDVAELRHRLPDAQCLLLPGDGPACAVYEQCAQHVMQEIKSLVHGSLTAPALLQVVVPVLGPMQVLAGLAGLLKSAQLEHPKLQGQLIALEETEIANLADVLLANAGNSAQQVRYADGVRSVAGWTELTGQAPATPWRSGGVYLITGGTGGLGLIFAAEIARQVQRPTLVLTARSALTEAQRERLAELAASGARVEFRQVDVTQRDQVRQLIAGIHTDCGALHGIVHSAGVLRDGLIAGKTASDLAQVLAPKVAGLVNLDEASRDCALDCLILFSSTSAALGNAGQADYAAANAFMDAYAGYRNALVAGEQRRGRTLSVNWPLWADGGMQVDTATRHMLWQALGMRPLGSENGIAALYQAWASGQDQLMVIEGDTQRLLRMAGRMHDVQATATAVTVPAAPEAQGALETLISQAVSEILRLAPEQVENDRAWQEFGFDSVTLFELSNLLNRRHRLEVAPTMFFEHATIAALGHALAGRMRAHPVAAPVPLAAVASGTRIGRQRRPARPRAGLRQIVIDAAAQLEAALYYPASEPAGAMEMGVFTLDVALDAARPERVKGLLVVSHGAGGGEYSHHDLCCALAGDGYLVAAVRHPGDNWRDTSLLASAAYLSERPKALSRTIDHLLADPHWGQAIPADAIGAIGHSAGAASVLAVLGALADPHRLLAHCEAVDDDPVICALASRAMETASLAPAPVAADFELGDARIRCALLMAPMSVVFTPESLGAITVPLKIYTAQEDRVFNGKYNGAQLRTLVRQAEFEEVAHAGHFAFMAQPNRSTASVIGDAAENPPGFDRAGFQLRLAEEACAFFHRGLDSAWSNRIDPADVASPI